MGLAFASRSELSFTGDPYAPIACLAGNTPLGRMQAIAGIAPVNGKGCGKRAIALFLTLLLEFPNNSCLSKAPVSSDPGAF